MMCIELENAELENVSFDVFPIEEDKDIFSLLVRTGSSYDELDS